MLNLEPLYACKYFMSRGHWQIHNHSAKGEAKYGRYESLPLHKVPAEVVKLALETTLAIRAGLYAVDLKQVAGRTVVIGLNNNPSIDAMTRIARPARNCSVASWPNSCAACSAAAL